MIEELKYRQEQQVLNNQISNLEALKAQQVKHCIFLFLKYEIKFVLFFRVKWKKNNVNN